jgi:predicted phosphodiesterase
MGKITKKGEVVREYCKKYPDMPNMTLARLIYSQNSALFDSVTAVRLSVKYHRGKHSCGSGKRNADPVPTTYAQSTVRNDYRAPKTYGKDRTDFVIHGPQRILRLSDIHFPIHDPAALDAAIKYGKEHDPTIILLDGDIADLSDMSRHEKTTLQNFVNEEMHMLVGFLDGLRATFPKARIIWKEGNHEERVTAYLMRKAPELLATDCFDLFAFMRIITGRMDATDRVEWVSDKRIIKAGHLNFLHGHEFRGGGGVNPARWLYLRTGENAICGHFHRTSEHSEPSLSGQQRGAWSTGCLCHLSPDYLRHNKWNHGFAWVEVDKAGNFRVKNIRILNGEIY